MNNNTKEAHKPSSSFKFVVLYENESYTKIDLVKHILAPVC